MKGSFMDQIARTTSQIAAIVLRERRRRGLSQDELGARIRLRQATISKLEASNPATRLSTLLDVLAALDLEIVVRPRTKASCDEIEQIF
jgi:HTH-type transcriptional regulator / antitoxin HipB